MQFLYNAKILVLNILLKSNPVKQKGKHAMPTETDETYEREICGAVVEVKESGTGTLECCGQPMTLKE